MHSRKCGGRSALRTRYVIATAVAAGVLLFVASCRESLTSPGMLSPFAGGPSLSLVEESPQGGSMEFHVNQQAPLAGAESTIAHFPSTTIVAMVAQQRFDMENRPPYLPGRGTLGLAGRSSPMGCSHQAEAYLLSFPDGGGYGYSFLGCDLAAAGLLTEYTDTVAVSGWVKWGYSYDAGCPVPEQTCTEYTGGSSVTLTRLPASLEISAEGAQGGVLKVNPKHPVLVYASAVPATIGRHRTPVSLTGGGWTFTPDSGAVREHACQNGDNLSCEGLFTQSGTLSVVALVNGARATPAPLRIETPKLTLSLSADSVAVGDTVVATVALSGAYADKWWLFDVSPALAAEGTGPGPNGLPPCMTTPPGPMRCYLVFAKAGTARVRAGAVLDDDVRKVAFRDVKVTAAAPAAAVEVRAESHTLMRFSEHIPAGNCPARDTTVTRPVHVAVVDLVTHARLPNRTVHLSLAALVPSDPNLPDEGGHVVSRHRGNPKPPGRLVDTVVVTDATGEAYVEYRASEFAGRYEVRGTSPEATPGADTITVGVALRPLAVGTHYSFIGDTPEHPVNHYGTPTMNGRLGMLADVMYDEFGINLEYNDIALPLGGRFEVADNSHPSVRWTNPAHCDHRFGRGTDVRTNPYQVPPYTKEKPSPTVKAMQLSWLQLQFQRRKGDRLPYYWEGDHLHLMTTR